MENETEIQQVMRLTGMDYLQAYYHVRQRTQLRLQYVRDQAVRAAQATARWVEGERVA